MRKQRTQDSLIFAAACLAVTGCGAGDQGVPSRTYRPVPGCEAFDHAPCDVADVACQTRLFAIAGCLRGQDPGALPPVTIMSEADFMSYVNAEAQKDVSPFQNTWDWALSSLKVIQAGALGNEAMISEAVKYIWGLYRPDTKDIVIVDHGAAFDAASASPVLVHELVHCLQDREIDIQQFQTTFAKPRDVEMAASAIIEGEARLHETRYRASVAGLDPAAVDWMRRFESGVGLDETYILMQPSPLTKGWQLFPYQWGARYVYYKWVEGRMNAVHDLLSSPPGTTRALMASMGMDITEAAPQAPALPTPPQEWVVSASDVLGAWGLLVALEAAAPTSAVATPDGTPSEADRLAAAWRGDNIGIFSAVGGRYAFVWRLELADAAAAETVRARLANLSGNLVSASGTKVVIARANDGLPLDWPFAP